MRGESLRKDRRCPSWQAYPNPASWSIGACAALEGPRTAARCSGPPATAQATLARQRPRQPRERASRPRGRGSSRENSIFGSIRKSRARARACGADPARPARRRPVLAHVGAMRSPGVRLRGRRFQARCNRAFP
jgi:hypothetical protein